MDPPGADGGRFDAKALQKAYVDFMTTPGTHNDCYASTCHRMFFENLSGGAALHQHLAQPPLQRRQPARERGLAQPPRPRRGRERARPRHRQQGLQLRPVEVIHP